MQLLAMGAFIIKEQGDDVGGFRRTDQRHGVGVEGGQIVLQLAAAIDGRRNKVNLAGCHNTGQDQTDRGETYRWQTASSPEPSPAGTSTSPDAIPRTSPPSCRSSRKPA